MLTRYACNTPKFAMPSHYNKCKRAIVLIVQSSEAPLARRNKHLSGVSKCYAPSCLTHPAVNIGRLIIVYYASYQTEISSPYRGKQNHRTFQYCQWGLQIQCSAVSLCWLQ